MLNRKTPDTLATKLTFKAFGEEVVVPVVFFNRTQTEIADKTAELNKEGDTTPEWVNREIFMYVVKEFNGVIPSHEGIAELEDNWPGSIIEVFYAYHDARKVAVVKN